MAGGAAFSEDIPTPQEGLVEKFAELTESVEQQEVEHLLKQGGF
jgi:hypothetical protein